MSGAAAGLLARVSRVSRVEHAEVPGRLAFLSRPSSDRLAEAVRTWRAAGIGTAAGRLEPDEVADLGLRALPGRCAAEGIEFLPFPVPDRGVPETPRDAIVLAGRLAARIGAGGSVGVHCRAGIGRSAVLAACVLGALGLPYDAALDANSAARGVPVPDTPEQRDWVRRVTGGSG